MSLPSHVNSQGRYPFVKLPLSESQSSLLQDGDAIQKEPLSSQSWSHLRIRRRFYTIGLLGGIALLFGCLILMGSGTRLVVQLKSTTQDIGAQTTENDSLQGRLQALFPYERKDSSTIPSIIWQTWKTKYGDKDFPARLQDDVDSWSLRNPNHTHQVLDDGQANEMVKTLYAPIPMIHEAYAAMPLNVHRADFFRYLVLFAMGGTYSDVDTRALKPISKWLSEIAMPEKGVGIIVGMEADLDTADWQKWFARRVQICQWTIRAKPGHPLLASMIATITLDTLSMKQKGTNTADTMEKSTLEYTGPGVFTDKVFEYLSDPRYFTREEKSKELPMLLGKDVTWRDLTGLRKSKMLGDLVLLPITSFSPLAENMGSAGVGSPLAFVWHEFQGE